MFTPKLPLDAAAPKADATEAAPPAATTQPEYVYLSREVVVVKLKSIPNANMPVVLFPAAEPPSDADVAAPPAATTHPE